MKYENFEGPAEELVRMKLKEIEEKLVYYKKLADSMKDDRNYDWTPLNKVFKESALK